MRINGIEGLITNVDIYGLEESLIRSGYPMATKPLTEDEFDDLSEDLFYEIFHASKCETEEQLQKHIKRGKKLGNALRGSGHDCMLKGIVVQFDLDFTIKAWTEAEREHNAQTKSYGLRYDLH